MSIVEVSKVAGVSVATVSRVLNGHPHVSDAAVKAVHAAVEKVGYRVPEFGNIGRPRSDAGGVRTGAIAVLFPDVRQSALRTTLSGRLLHGIDEQLRRRSLTMIVTGLEKDGSLPTCLERKQVDGVIVRGTFSAEELCSTLQGFPRVWVFESGYQAGLKADMVVENNETIGQMAARWLVARGHRRLAVLNLLRHHSSFRVRRLFFRDAAEQAGFDALSLLGDETDTVALVDRLLAEPNRPTGLFVPGSDDTVVDVYRALVARGIKIGADLDLISCYNDPERLSTLDPTLAHIDIQPEAIGRAAVDTLLWRMRHRTEEPRRMVIPPHLVEPAPVN